MFLRLVWVWNQVCRIKRRIEGIREESVGKNIWT